MDEGWFGFETYNTSDALGRRVGASDPTVTLSSMAVTRANGTLVTLGGTTNNACNGAAIGTQADYHCAWHNSSTIEGWVP